MKLADLSILARLRLPDDHPGRLRIFPFYETAVDLRAGWPDGTADGLTVGLTSAGYDFALSSEFLVPRPGPDWVADPTVAQSDMYVAVVADAVVIEPGETILGCTVETVAMPADVEGSIVGRSSYARVGLNLNCTPIEPMWEGRITLELSNTSRHRVVVRANSGIGQLQFNLLTDNCRTTYADKQGRYQGQTGPTAPIPRKRK